MIGRLVTDPDLRQRFGLEPEAVLGELVAEGFELTRVEREALAATEVEQLAWAAASFDRRLVRAARAAVSLPTEVQSATSEENDR